MQRPAHRH